MQQRPEKPFTILVVEDEALIRAALCQVLEDAGFAVREADCVARAVDALTAADGEHIHAVFSDIQMPGAVDGLALADWIREKRPDVAVLLTSGYPGRSLGANRHAFLPKPYDFDQLVAKLRAMLET
jgi:DNA-binding NtrC family response regulator